MSGLHGIWSIYVDCEPVVRTNRNGVQFIATLACVDRHGITYSDGTLPKNMHMDPEDYDAHARGVVRRAKAILAVAIAGESDE